MTKNPTTIKQQIKLLEKRNLKFKNKKIASVFLSNISYYRLGGYWWDIQKNNVKHQFYPDSYFKDVIDRYNYDKQLRLILFEAVDVIEIALRTKMIYNLSLKYGAYWYKDDKLFYNRDYYYDTKNYLYKEYKRSSEIFIKKHDDKYPNKDPESWKIMEIASVGTLSKFYKNLNHQLPEKSNIAQGMGLNLHNELSSWLESVVYVRNIVAHHSRLWNRTMVKKPKTNIKNPKGPWFNNELKEIQKKKPFLIISLMVYLSSYITGNYKIRNKILKLNYDYSNLPIDKMGFTNNWDQEPLWNKNFAFTHQPK